MKTAAKTNISVYFLLLVSVTIFTACSSDSGTNGGGGSQAVDAGSDATINPDFSGPNGDAADDATAETGTPDMDPTDAPLDGPPEGTLGAPCSREGDCTDGEVCAGADPRYGIVGYCTILDCADHTECEFGDGEVYCCSDYPGVRGCFREDPETVCGGGDGEQGDSCADGGQSDCDGAGHYCVDFYGDPFCAQLCRPGAGPNQPGTCPDGNWCYDVGGGNGICVPGGDREVREGCGDDPFQCGDGTMCVGAWEDPPSPYSYCAALCSGERDCEEDEWCEIYPGQGQGTCNPEGDGDIGDSCTEDRWGCSANQFCMNENTRYAVCTNICRGERDCDRGFYCAFFTAEMGVCLNEGDRETGESCGDAAYACLPEAACIGAWGYGYNDDAFCSDECTDDAGICGAGFYCEDFEEVSHCMPDGDADVRAECDSVLDCPEGTTCLYRTHDRPGRCQPYCETDDECLGTEWCTDDICLPKGDAGPGAACDADPFVCGEDAFCGGGGDEYCVATCTGDPDICTGGTFCSDPDEEGNQYCILTGDTAIGEACSETHECVEGAFCMFNNDERDGVCTTGCWFDHDCYANAWCLNAGQTNACIPHGDIEQGESCAGANRLKCASQHMCFYDDTDQAFCAKECTGFADTCGENERCTYVGWGANFCLPVGELAVGADCSDNLGGCDVDTLCLGAATDDAFCATTCTFDADGCGDGEKCHFYRSGVGFCVPPGFDPDNVDPF